jgi:tetratricopeptide (TPR) repeat protein
MRLSLLIALPLSYATVAREAPSPPAVAEARRLYSQTDYRGALDLLRKLRVQNSISRELSGRCRYFMGDYKAAIDDLEKAVRQEPDVSDHYLWLGRAWGRRAETSVFFLAVKYASETRKNFEKAVQLNPSSIEAVNDLLTFYLEAPGVIGGGVERATTLAATVREKDPVEHQYALAQIAIHQKDFEAAESYLRKAVELAPRRVNRIVDLAKFLASRGKLRESDELFEQAASIDPKSKRLLYGRAEAYIKGKRNLDAAKKSLEDYLQSSLTPDDPSREQALKLIQRAAAGGGSGD